MTCSAEGSAVKALLLFQQIHREGRTQQPASWKQAGNEALSVLKRKFMTLMQQKESWLRSAVSK